MIFVLMPCDRTDEILLNETIAGQTEIRDTVARAIRSLAEALTAMPHYLFEEGIFYLT